MFLIKNPSKTSISRFLITPQYYASSAYLITELPTQESLQSKVQVEYLLNVPVLISAELAALRRGSRQLVRKGRGHERAKKPGKLVPRLRELHGDFGRKSVASGWCLVLAGHPVHTPHLPRFTARWVTCGINISIFCSFTFNPCERARTHS